MLQVACKGCKPWICNAKSRRPSKVRMHTKLIVFYCTRLSTCQCIKLARMKITVTMKVKVMIILVVHVLLSRIISMTIVLISKKIYQIKNRTKRAIQALP